MEKTYVYALDLSLNSSGVCIFTDDGYIVKLLTIDTHSKKETKLKLATIGKNLLRLIKKYPPKVVVIEQGFSLFNASTQAIFKTHGVVNYIFSKYEQIYYPATTVKKVISGKGNTSKEELKKILNEQYPDISFFTLDESDAFALGETYFIKKGIKNASKDI